MFTRFVTYIKETRQELRKVNWPTRSQTFQYTLLVIGVSLGVALLLGGFDYLYKYLLTTFVLSR